MVSVSFLQKNSMLRHIKEKKYTVEENSGSFLRRPPRPPPPPSPKWANIYLHTLDSDLRFLPNRSPTSFTLFFQDRIEGQRLLLSIFCKVGVDGTMFFYIDSVKVNS